MLQQPTVRSMESHKMTGTRSSNSNAGDVRDERRPTEGATSISVWRKPATWLGFMVTAAVLYGSVDWLRSKRASSARENIAMKSQEAADGFPYAARGGFGEEVKAQLTLPVLLRFPGVDGDDVEESLSNHLISGIGDETAMRMAVLCIIADAWANDGLASANSIDVSGAFSDPWGVMGGDPLGMSAEATVLTFRRSLRKAAWAAEEIHRRNQTLDWKAIEDAWATHKRR